MVIVCAVGERDKEIEEAIRKYNIAQKEQTEKKLREFRDRANAQEQKPGKKKKPKIK